MPFFLSGADHLALLCDNFDTFFSCVFQHALRLMAFGQIYKVLEMDPLPSSKPSQKFPWSDKEGEHKIGEVLPENSHYFCKSI